MLEIESISTRDMDIDFIKYSVENKSILNFIKELNNTDEGVSLLINSKEQIIVEKLKSL